MAHLTVRVPDSLINTLRYYEEQGFSLGWWLDMKLTKQSGPNCRQEIWTGSQATFILPKKRRWFKKRGTVGKDGGAT